MDRRALARRGPAVDRGVRRGRQLADRRRRHAVRAGLERRQRPLERRERRHGRDALGVQVPCPEYGRYSEGDKGLYSGPSSTPVRDPQTGYLYTLGIDGQLNCWNARGRRIWDANLYDRFAAPQRPKVGRSGLRDYGYTSSPLIHGDWLLVEAGAPSGNLVALDKRSGKTLWSSENRDPAGHTAGPVPITIDGIPAAVVLTHRRLVVVRLDGGHAGATLAEYPWETSFANNVVTPTVHGQSVLLTSGYEHESIVRLDLSASGLVEVWKQPYSSKVASPVVVDGNVCWSWQEVRCLDFASGKQRWAGGGFGDAGSVIATSDGRLVVWGGEGRLALVEGPARSPDAYRELARRDGVLSSDAWPHAALAERRLYLKDRSGALACFALAP